MKKSKKIIILKNIPSPYRNKLFNMMQEIFPEYQLSFEVWYLAKSESNRHWIIDENDFKYKHKYLKGFHPKIGNMFAHINLSLIPALLTSKYDTIIIGGYGAPSLMMAPIFIRKNVKKILWSETNDLSTTKIKGLSQKLKKQIVNFYDAFLVPGERACKFVLNFTKGPKEIINLPNLIDQSKYTTEIDKLRINRKILRESWIENPNDQIWICPAQLEKKKGLLEFLPSLKNIKNVHLLIAGEGSLKDEILHLIQQYQLRVTLVGFQQQNEMLKFYAMADVFILPSISDPSPLSVIEAIAAGLPILISNRVGNFPEVYSNENGWEYDVFANITEREKLVEVIARKSNEDLFNIGLKSRATFYKNFDAVKFIRNFADSLTHNQN